MGYTSDDINVLVNALVAALRQELTNFSANFNRNENDNAAFSASSAEAKNKNKNKQDQEQESEQDVESKTNASVYNGNSWLSHSGNAHQDTKSDIEAEARD
nr:hypothetical protein [Lysinibacillus timonensis]